MFFHVSYVFQDVLFTRAIVSHYPKNSFFPFIPSSSSCCERIQNITVERSRNVTKECNVIAGTSYPNVSWRNVKTCQVIEGKLLTIINISGNQSGEYRYTANNTCGNESTGMFIDVHCKNLYKFFTRLGNVCYSMPVSMLYNSVLSHTAIISMLLSSQSSYYKLNLVRVKYPFDCNFLVD